MSKFIEEAKRFIMKSIAEEQPSVGQSIFWKRLAVPLAQLPPPVRDAIEVAMKELQDEGIFDANQGITEKGISLIYGTSSERIADVQHEILAQLREMGARVGYTPNWRAFITAPQAFREAIPDAVKGLQRDGILDEKEALTQKGYERLY